MTTLVPPASGLKQLTWPQVEKFDAKVRSLCVWVETNGNDDEVVLPVIIRKGRPVKIGRPMLMERFKPTAL